MFSAAELDSREKAYAAALREVSETRSSPAVVISDTGQIRRHAAEGVLLVDTPRTQIAAGFLAHLAGLADRLSDLSIDCGTRFATVGVTALDDHPIRDSRRLLLVAVANARNADTKCRGGFIEKMGTGPVIAEPVTAAIKLQSSHAAVLQVFAPEPLTGVRRRSLTVRHSAGAVEFSIDDRSRTIYYEIAVQTQGRTPPTKGR